MNKMKFLAALASLVIGICSVSVPVSADWSKTSAGKYFYTDSSGNRVTGWNTIGGKKYYFDSSGYMKTGWLKLGSDYYYLQSDGSAVTGKTVTIDGKSYSFGKDGKYIPGYADGWHRDGSGKYFYTIDNKKLTGFQKISGSSYYFSNDGTMAEGSVTVGKYEYYFSSDGKMYKGWKKSGTDYYYYMSDGRMAKSTSLRIDGITYVFGPDGKYAAPASSRSDADASYVLNTNTKKFHDPDCPEVKRIKDKNRYDYSGTRDEVIDMGYVPCQKCDP